jgi:peptide methionine sulfoxide reductase MsrA
MSTNHKTAVVAGGCFWGEKSLGDFSQDLASLFVNEMKQTGDKVYSFCKKEKTSI